MAGFKKLGYGAKQVHRHAGKGATEQLLPHRSALNTLTRGDVSKRSMNDYAKVTPGPGDAAPDINDFGSSTTNPYLDDPA